MCIFMHEYLKIMHKNEKVVDFYSKSGMIEYAKRQTCQEIRMRDD